MWPQTVCIYRYFDPIVKDASPSPFPFSHYHTNQNPFQEPASLSAAAAAALITNSALIACNVPFKEGVLECVANSSPANAQRRKSEDFCGAGAEQSSLGFKC